MVKRSCPALQMGHGRFLFDGDAGGMVDATRVCVKILREKPVSERETVKGSTQMIGAIAGDIIGSIYEVYNIKTTDFPLFSRYCRFTGDTVLTVALADSILDGSCYIAHGQKLRF